MKKLILPILLISFFLIQVSPAFAQGNSESTRERVKNQIEQKFKETKDRLASKAAIRKEKLEATKLRVCETKKSAIVRRSTRLAERAGRQLTNFSTKSTRVETFYNDRLVPRGVVVDNYDDLVADIEAKAQAVAEAIESAKTTAANFDCAGDDPKGQLTNYRTDMQNAIKALKEYRLSIKNLIVAIKHAAAKTATSSANN